LQLIDLRGIRFDKLNANGFVQHCLNFGKLILNPDNPLENLTGLPLFKRGRACEGAEGDFCVLATLKSPLAPLLQRGGCVIIAQIKSNGLSGLKEHLSAEMLPILIL